MTKEKEHTTENNTRKANRVYIEPDKELTNIIIHATLVKTNDNITKELRKAYELGFKRDYRASKYEDMPWCFRAEEEEEDDDVGYKCKEMGLNDCVMMII